MKKSISITLITLLALGFAGIAAACYWDGRWYGGPGMNQGGYGVQARGYMGYGNCPWDAGYYGGTYNPNPNPTFNPSSKLITRDQAEQILQNYLFSTRNPNLKIGQITETDTYFEAEIVTRDNSLVDKVLVDKRLGAIRSAY
jgi:hypothetical protein